MTDKPKRVTTTDVLVSLAETLKNIDGKMAALADKIEVLMPKKEPDRPSAPVTQPAMSHSPHPVPSEYREIVDEILNQSFGLEIEAMSDQPMFVATVVVPETYSNAGKSYLDTYKVDRRVKTLTYAEGKLGVREWVEKVFNNFNQDTRTRIVMDRVKEPSYAA